MTAFDSSNSPSIQKILSRKDRHPVESLLCFASRVQEWFPCTPSKAKQSKLHTKVEIDHQKAMVVHSQY
jgi:hypothetical protein